MKSSKFHDFGVDLDGPAATNSEDRSQNHRFRRLEHDNEDLAERKTPGRGLRATPDDFGYIL